MKDVNLNNVQEASSSNRLVPGGYVCGIVSVEDVADKEYLKFEFDVAEGDYKNYYKTLCDSKGFWGGSFIRSYKEKALPFFKATISAIEKSNNGFKFNYDEKKLRGKLVGIVLSEEEYIKSDNSIGTRLYASDFKSVDDIRKGNYKVRDIKRVETPQDTSITTSNLDIIIDADDDLPWE